jgi:hypothetical protein
MLELASPYHLSLEYTETASIASWLYREMFHQTDKEIQCNASYFLEIVPRLPRLFLAYITQLLKPQATRWQDIFDVRAKPDTKLAATELSTAQVASTI